MQKEDKLIIGGHEFHSRFILGSGKYSLKLIEAAVKDAGAEIITLAVRRANTKDQENILDYKSMTEAYQALKSVEEGTRAKYTKEGFVSIICDFLDRQGLIVFVQEDEMIKTTPKLDNIMEYKILNKDNYTAIMEVLRAEDEQDRENKNFKSEL